MSGINKNIKVKPAEKSARVIRKPEAPVLTNARDNKKNGIWEKLKEFTEKIKSKLINANIEMSKFVTERPDVFGK